MGSIAYRIGACIAACCLSLAAGMPLADADSVTLPPMASTGGGPVIGGGGAAQQMSQQLKSLGDAGVQEVDGSDAAQFITAAAAITNRDLASPFMTLQRALSCQTNNAGFGARAYRRNDGQWGGAMLVIAKSATPDVDALGACVKSNWHSPTAGGPSSMCNVGWTYPTSGDNHRPETYYILLAGTASNFCSGPDENYRNYATGWP
jgi:hypothetical protein